MIRIHKRSKITYASIRNGGLYVMEEDEYNPSKYNWEPLKEYVLQTELVGDSAFGCLVEKQDADEYTNEKRYTDEIERLKNELTTIETKLKEVEEKSTELNTQIEWLTEQNQGLGELLEQERKKKMEENERNGSKKIDR